MAIQLNKKITHCAYSRCKDHVKNKLEKIINFTYVTVCYDIALPNKKDLNQIQITWIGEKLYIII